MPVRREKRPLTTCERPRRYDGRLILGFALYALVNLCCLFPERDPVLGDFASFSFWAIFGPALGILGIGCCQLFAERAMFSAVACTFTILGWIAIGYYSYQILASAG